MQEQWLFKPLLIAAPAPFTAPAAVITFVV